VPKLRWLEIRGFRAFGPEPQRLEFSTNFAVICGPNSQGKTSIAEAFEFLLTGGTVRREFLASAKAEFSDSLRNAYLQSDGEVFVRAGIEDSNRLVHVACRKLISDYTALDDCRSLLTVDGHAVPNLESLGFLLSEAPLRAPVLLQHTLRYVLSSRPTDRSDYFKALLEIGDLEFIRTIIGESASLADVQKSPILNTLQKCSSISGIATAIQGIGDHAPQGNALREIICTALGAVATASGLGEGSLPSGLLDRAEILRANLETKRQSAFPLSAFAADSQSNLHFDAPEFLALDKFAAAARETTQDLTALTELYLALLAIPAVENATAPTDCPACNTHNALTPSRLDEIRGHVAASAGLRLAKSLAAQEVLALQNAAITTKNSLAQILPRFALWDESASLEHREIISQILPETGTTMYDQIVSALPALREAISSATRSLSDVDSAASSASLAIRGFDEITGAELREKSVALEEALGKVREQLDNYRERARALTVPLQQQIDRKANLEGWQELLEIVENIEPLEEALVEAKARALVRSDVEEALVHIDQAKASVFDENFVLLSDEIEGWWKKVRPDESVAFGGLRRRGTGRRFVDVKAILFTDSRTEAVERDAAGIFSDSQLNCFGLSAFLARCVREKSPVIVLDDPVSASDAAHRATFAYFIPRELLAKGAQVLVMTFDEELSRLAQQYYADLPADFFSISLSVAEAGAEVVKTSDTLEALLASAKPYIRNQNREIRKICARQLRDAAERFCKEIIIKNQSSPGIGCSITDLGGKNLMQLVPDAEPYLVLDSSHPGKLRAVARLLNPGSHDDPPPEVADLSVAYGDIVRFKREYL
jgi:hypothetical protein